jgi:NADPH:quinone reductase-like Zn-dependent oxidoreductase
MGADHAIDYKTQDFVAEVARITNKRGVNVLLDMVGGDYVEKNLKCLALEGRLTQIGFLNGSRVNVELHHLLLKRLTVTGSTLRASPLALKVALAQSLRENVWPLFAQRRLQVVIQETMPLVQARDAHALMESGRLIGKVILKVAA